MLPPNSIRFAAAGEEMTKKATRGERRKEKDQQHVNDQRSERVLSQSGQVQETQETEKFDRMASDGNSEKQKYQHEQAQGDDKEQLKHPNTEEVLPILEDEHEQEIPPEPNFPKRKKKGKEVDEKVY